MPLLQVLTGRSGPDLQKDLGEILELLVRHESSVDAAKVCACFDLAREVHQRQRRMDGQPYIVHPLAVAKTCAEHWLDDVSVSAALLHDTVEDADKNLALTPEVLESRFGADVASIVRGVTKLKKDLAGEGKDPHVETLKKLLLSASREDVRVIIIKIFDRYHNAQTLGVFPEHKRLRIGEETMRFYVPIAERLGFYKVARGMEDSVFKALQPEIHAQVDRWIAQDGKRKRGEVQARLEDIKKDLSDKGIDVADKFYAKGSFAIYRLARNPDGSVNLGRLEEVPAFNICLIVPDVDSCFRTLSLVHSKFKFHPEGVRDFINNPKINGYQSLHTVVRGPGLSRITVVIRTSSMDWRNHLGVIADLRTGRIQESRFLRDLVESLDLINPSELLELTGRLFFPEIDVTSPAGDSFKLPLGSTALDFAYHLHTDLGDRARIAVIGGREKKLGTRLRSGQKVEIVKAKDVQVTPAWIEWVKTDRARFAIRRHFNRAERQAVAQEPERFVAFLKQKLGVGIKLNGPEMTALRKLLCYDSDEALGMDMFVGLLPYDRAIFEIVPMLGRGDLKKLAKALHANGVMTEQQHSGLASLQQEQLASSLRTAQQKALDASVEGRAGYVEVAGARFAVAVHFAVCCRPGFGDPIVALGTRDRGIGIHRETCRNVSVSRAIGSIHLLGARWRQSPMTRRMLVQVEGSDRRNLLHDLTRVLSEHRVNIIELDIRALESDRFGGMIMLEVSDLTSLETLVGQFNAVKSLNVTDSWLLP